MPAIPVLVLSSGRPAREVFQPRRGAQRSDPNPHKRSA